MRYFKKSQVALEFLTTYGWAILVVLVAIGALAYFGVLTPNKFLSEKTEQRSFDDISYKVCNNLIVDEEIYPFLKSMGDGLKEENKATDIFYKKETELKSDINVFKNTGRIFCSVPVELCFTENGDYLGGSYCFLMRLELGIDYLGEFKEWFEGVQK